MPRLLIVRGANAGVGYDLGEHTRIGRLGENEIQVSDPNVSRLHAEIVRNGDDLVIFDRGSKNGVLINGHEIAEKSLLPGDEIVIGASVFLFEPDFTVKNARFSDTSAIVAEADGDNAKFTTCEILDKRRCAGAALPIATLATMLGADTGNLQELGKTLADNIQAFCDAKNVVLLLRDYPGGELRVLESVPHCEQTVLYGELLDRCEAEIATISVCEPAPDISGLNGGRSDSNANITPVADDDVAKTERKSYTAALSPILFDKKVMGVQVALRETDEPFTEETLCHLDGVSRLVSNCLKSARDIERARRAASECDYLDPESRSASSRSLRMQEIYNSAKRSADGDGIILITGENGTGKETLAKFVHESGPRSTGPFVVFNCASVLPENFETELFGAEGKESCGNAVRTTAGRVEEAQGGTLLLSEVGELDLALQPKLLRYLQDRAYYRVDGKMAHKSDVRVIASTSIDLASAVRAGKFREDLWYRLNVVPFNMPPLRERREDIGPLLDFFLARHAIRLNRKVLGANDGAVALLQKYDWPGNIRELDNAVERAVLLCEGKVLSTSDFSHIEDARRRLNSQADLERKRDTKPLAEVERQHIMIALKKHNFNQARAAEALGLHRNTLRNKIIEYGIEINK